MSFICCRPSLFGQNAGIIALAGLIACAPVSKAAFIVPSALVPPGGPSVGVPLTSAAAGTLLATLLAPYSFVTTAGTTSGTVLSAVYRNPSGTLDFYYQIANSANSATSLSRESSTSFKGNQTSVAFRLDGSSLGNGFVNSTAGIVPVTADRDASGTTVGFNFIPAPPGTKIPPGTTSAVLVISTDATTFTAGNATVIDGGTQTVAAFQPGPSLSFSKAFSPTSINIGGPSTLTFTIKNNGGAAVTGLAFTDTLPSGVIVATPNGLTDTCGGTATATAGSNSISLTGGTVNAPSGTTCTISVNVVGTTEGTKLNTSSTLTSTNAPTAAAAVATLTVAGSPILTKSFGSLTLLPGSSSSLTFALTNPNSVLTLTGLAFTDTLPTGLLVSSPNGLVGSCGGGTITATAGSNLVTLTNATLAPGASCTFSVNVTASTIELGLLTNTTSTVTADQALPGAPASASIFVGNPFQVRSASNLAIGDSMINITNKGTSSTAAFPAQDGNICLNVYTFSPDEQLISCCSCLVTPDGLASLSARNDLISNTLTPGVPTSIVIKLLGSSGTTPASCNASTVGTATNQLVAGLAAWGTTIHALPVTPQSPATTYGVTESAFTPSTLSVAELTRITALCGFIQTNGSGFGICKSCRLGGLADTQ